LSLVHPAAAGDAERLGLLASTLGLVITPAQRAALLAYLDLLARWNQTYNLTAVRGRDAMWTQHLADCLAILPALDRRVAAGRALDVGSGGGLPGVLLAIMRPALTVSCIDTVGKKAAFVRQVAGALALPNLHALHGRVESLHTPPFDLITARAFASLTDFSALTRRLLAPGGLWLAMKGKPPHDEIAALPAEIEVFHVEPILVPGLEAERCLVWMQPRPTTSP
jgi:16S rRNA (guanine527-N7)-methyltransferase